MEADRTQPAWRLTNPQPSVSCAFSASRPRASAGPGKCTRVPTSEPKLKGPVGVSLSFPLSPSRMNPSLVSLWDLEQHHAQSSSGDPSASPAVDDDGPGVRWGGGLHAPDEGQQPCGVVGDAVLRPRCEVELADLMPGRVASLGRQAESLLPSVRHPPGEHLTTGSQLIPIINV